MAFRENDSGLIDWSAMKFLENDAYIKAKKSCTNDLNKYKIYSFLSRNLYIFHSRL